MRKNGSCAVVAAVVGGMIGGASFGGVQGTGGAVNPIGPPPSLLSDALESSTDICLIAEQQGLVLPTSLLVDAMTPGVYTTSGGLTPGHIAAGVSISSYILHADPVGLPSGGLILSGSVTFDQDILGVIVNGQSFLDSDGVVGNSGRIYPFELTRGLEFESNDDRVSISGDRRTLTVQMEMWNMFDQVRVIVAAPIPAPGALAMLGVCGLMGCRRRR